MSALKVEAGRFTVPDPFTPGLRMEVVSAKVADDLLVALVDAITGWDLHYDKLPVSDEIEDCEFSNFQRGREALARALQCSTWVGALRRARAIRKAEGAQA